jgi:TFIIF-interacting CTD phosphatase-like protein
MTKKLYNVFLDLDNTAINSRPTNSSIIKKRENKLYKWKTYWHIYARKDLQKFLKFLFDNFNVSVFTAAGSDYGEYIIDNIIAPKDSGRKICHFLHSTHCDDSFKLYGKQKDMRYVFSRFKECNKNNTVLIDDLRENCDFQLKNCIRVKPFNVTDKPVKDDELANIIDKLCKFVISKYNII